jgi:hypothetical protein
MCALKAFPLEHMGRENQASTCVLQAGETIHYLNAGWGLSLLREHTHQPNASAVSRHGALACRCTAARQGEPSLASRSYALRKTALLTLGIWVGSLGPMGLVVILFGECSQDPRPNGLALCTAEQQSLIHLIGAAVFVASLPLAAWLYRRFRREGPRT